MGAPLRILCTGDLHIGRRPSRLASEEDARLCSCAAILGDIVDLAVRERVDVVLFSGDVVDKDNRFFEAIGPLERGLAKLSKAGIPAVAVSGNHDFDVLPQLADQFTDGRFRLIGRDGKWDRFTLIRNGQQVLHIDGWSFSEEHVAENPMRSFKPQDSSDGLPVIGMLHGDLDNAQSKYAPVSRADFRSTGADLWLLGHIHQFKVHAEGHGPTVMYPGSPQAMDPGEPGAHGPWIIELGERGSRIKPVHVPMSKVRYDAVPVDLTDTPNQDAVRKRVLEVVHAHAVKISESCGLLQFASFRLLLKGRTPEHRHIPKYISTVVGDLERSLGGFSYRIEQIEVATRPAYSLKEMAHGSDAPSVLARMLIALDGDSTETSVEIATFDPLVRQVSQALASVHGANAYPLIDTDPAPDSGFAKAVLVKQGYALLDALMEQREEAVA